MTSHNNPSPSTNLHRVAEILTREAIPFWVDQGTLLGIIRDSALLPWEKDIDISLWQEDIDRVLALKSELEAQGMYVEHHASNDTIYINGTTGYFVDLAFFHRTETHAIRNNTLPKTQSWQKFVKRVLQLLPHSIHIRVRHFLRSTSPPQQVQLSVPIHFFQSFESIDFEGRCFQVPSRVEDYLAFKYGKDWQTPKRDWDFATQDGAVVAASN